ncbi:MAG TPA: DUF4178 domain-containing protein [Longimicrobium sp.]|nr:DUF4178 domain-containing protein [Longimicrobium sp.]
MGFLDNLLGRAPAPARVEPEIRIEDLILSKLRKGYLVDFDDRTWEVVAQARVECAERSEGGQRWSEDEWSLRGPDAAARLRRREMHGVVSWELLSPLRLDEVDMEIRDALVRDGAPGAQGFFEDQPIFRDYMAGAALYHRVGQTEEDGTFFWNYNDDLHRPVLRVEQQGNAIATVALLTPVEEYQFNNILPGAAR